MNQGRFTHRPPHPLQAMYKLYTNLPWQLFPPSQNVIAHIPPCTWRSTGLPRQHRIVTPSVVKGTSKVELQKFYNNVPDGLRRMDKTTLSTGSAGRRSRCAVSGVSWSHGQVKGRQSHQQPPLSFLAILTARKNGSRSALVARGGRRCPG